MQGWGAGVGWGRLTAMRSPCWSPARHRSPLSNQMPIRDPATPAQQLRARPQAQMSKSPLSVLATEQSRAPPGPGACKPVLGCREDRGAGQCPRGLGRAGSPEQERSAFRGKAVGLKSAGRVARAPPLLCTVGLC